MAVLLVSAPALAKYRVELEPFITLRHEYNDNIYLDKTDREADQITHISPGLKFKISSRRKGLEGEYSPSWAFYHSHSEENFLRHRARVHLWNNIRKNLRLDFTDTFVRSNEAADADLNDERSRINLTGYDTNDANVSLKYQYGRYDFLTLGYLHKLREYDDDTYDDVIEQGPFFSILHWPDFRNGVDFHYAFTSYTYDTDDDTPSRTDYYGHNTGLGYLYRFSPHTMGNLGYDLFIRDARDGGSDYMVHQVSAGIEKELDSHTTLSLEGGAFTTTGDIERITGYIAEAKWQRKVERGTLTLGVERGWDEGFLDAEERGFATTWRVYADANYRLRKDLTSYAGVSYRDYSYQLENEDDYEVINGRCGLNWEVSNWLSLGLDYSLIILKSDEPAEDYVNNRVGVTATFSRLFEWWY